MRRSANELERIRAEAVERGRELAVAQERERQRRELSTSVMETMELIAGGWDAEQDGAVRARARLAAARLRSSLSRDHMRAEGALAEGLQVVVETFAEVGLITELLLGELGELDGSTTQEQADLVCGAVGEALFNISRHAGPTPVVVRVWSDSSQPCLRVSVRDHGAGCDQQLLDGGWGVRTRIVEPLTLAGGEASVRSSPGRGTRVALALPL